MIRISRVSVHVCYLEKTPELGYRDVGQSYVGMPKCGSVLLSTGTGGIEVSPPGPNPYNGIYSFRTFFFPKKKFSKITLMHQKLHFRKINPGPSLALPYAFK